jgi:hypothetical protein
VSGMKGVCLFGVIGSPEHPIEDDREAHAATVPVPAKSEHRVFYVSLHIAAFLNNVKYGVTAKHLRFT